MLRCTVCAHPDAVPINEAIVGLEGRPSNRRIAAQYGLSEQAIRQHKEHIPQLLVKASEAEEIAHADTLLDEVRALKDRTGAILDKAEEGGDLRTALSAIRELRGNLELLGRLLGELQEGQTVNIMVNPQWIQLRTLIVGALEAYPSARRAVLEAIEGVDYAIED